VSPASQCAPGLSVEAVYFYCCVKSRVRNAFKDYPLAPLSECWTPAINVSPACFTHQGVFFFPCRAAIEYGRSGSGYHSRCPRTRQKSRSVYITVSHRRCACVNTGEALTCCVPYLLSFGRRTARLTSGLFSSSLSFFSSYLWFNDAVLGYGLGNRGIRVRIPTGGKRFVLHSGHTGSWTHPVSENGGSFPPG
jgi:hypothetical protein